MPRVERLPRLIPSGSLYPIQNCQSISWFSDSNWTDCQLADLKFDYQLLPTNGFNY